MAWADARAAVHATALASIGSPTTVALADADGQTLAESLITLTDLPAFPTSSVDGYAVRGAGPWAVNGRVLAGEVAGAIAHGTAVEIATGAMVPAGTEHILRVEESEQSEVDG